MTTATNQLWALSGQRYQLPSGTKDTSTSGTTAESGTTVQSSSGSKVFSSQNTPQFALSALQQLIAQLSDQPNVSQEQAESKAPSLQRVFKPGTVNEGGGWTWKDPLNPNIVYRGDDPKVAQIQAERAAQRQQIIAGGGVTAGGTVETKRAVAERQTEITRDRTQQGAYSKEAAFADAGALQGRFTRQLLEQLMPNITRAAESSGTSGGAVAGLMAQDAAARTAEAQASLGLQTSVQYGQIYNQLAQTLELLTRDNSPTTKALLEAIGLSRGTISQGSEATSGQQVQQTTGAKTINSTEQVDQSGTAPAQLPLSNQIQAGAPAPQVNPSSTYMDVQRTTGSDNTLLAMIDDLMGQQDLTEGYQF